MNFRIKKGKHRAWPNFFGLLLSKKIRYRVTFDTSAKYFIGEDQQDVNKLFGIGFFPNHHKESARIGWRYNENLNRVEILSYCYVNSSRVIDVITSVPFHVSHIMTIEISGNEYVFTVHKEMPISTSVSFSHRKKIGYRLGCYFGGNQAAPHNITIEMKKV